MGHIVLQLIAAICFMSSAILTPYEECRILFVIAFLLNFISALLHLCV